MLLQYIHIIFYLMMPSILWSAPVPPAAKHPHNMMPHPCFTVGMVLFGLQDSPFFLQTWQWSLWPNSCIFVSSDQRTFLQKVRSLSLCAVANRNLAFSMAILEQWLLPCWSGLSGYVDIGLVLLWIYTFVPVSSRIFFLLIFPWCQAKRHWVWR